MHKTRNRLIAALLTLAMCLGVVSPLSAFAAGTTTSLEEALKSYIDDSTATKEPKDDGVTTIKLTGTSDTTYTLSTPISVATEVTLDLGGHELNVTAGDKDHYAITVEDDGKLTIKNGTLITSSCGIQVEGGGNVNVAANITAGIVGIHAEGTSAEKSAKVNVTNSIIKANVGVEAEFYSDCTIDGTTISGSVMVGADTVTPPEQASAIQVELKNSIIETSTDDENSIGIGAFAASNIIIENSTIASVTGIYLVHYLGNVTCTIGKEGEKDKSQISGSSTGIILYGAEGDQLTIYGGTIGSDDTAISSYGGSISVTGATIIAPVTVASIDGDTSDITIDPEKNKIYEVPFSTSTLPGNVGDDDTEGDAAATQGDKDTISTLIAAAGLVTVAVELALVFFWDRLPMNQTESAAAAVAPSAA